MKKVTLRVGIVVLSLVVTLVGCGSKQQSQKSSSQNGYKTAISKGLDAVAQDNFDQATSYFENALDEKAKDKTAKAYLAQVKSLVAGQKLIKSGDPLKAEKVLQEAIAQKGGARALETKLRELQDTLKADVKQYKAMEAALTQANKQSTVKQFDQASATLAPFAKTDWAKATYLSKLKPKFDSLSKTVSEAQAQSKAAASSKAAATAEANKTHQQAQDIRSSILSAYPGQLSSSELGRVPDSVVIKAYNDSVAVEGDIGVTESEIERQYPRIRVAQDSAQSGDHEAAQQVRDTMVQRFGLDATALAAISDSEILECSAGSATSSELAQTEANLVAKYPSLEP
ncbi:hypothetical protein [Lacticaseibacillus absianus]|uniref:hypothetical protein n=1 Tax=Lacticaseibacillus absianus TaxID=2729623 RepID=UPI0015CCE95F|nr:hypothetical protein [Lacticaseibacillus absianus]